MPKSLTLLGAGNAGGYSLSFNGSNTYVQQNSAGVYSHTTPYWISFWVKGSAQSDKVIVGHGRSSTTTPIFTLASGLVGTSKLKAFVRDDTSTIKLNSIESTTTVFDNTPHHVVWVDNAGTAALYIDKVQDATNFNYTPTALTIDRFAVGAVIRTSVANYFNGLIDNVSVGTGTLSAQDITDLYDKKYPTSYLTWKFDEGSGTSATDSSGNNRTGTINNATYSVELP